MHQRFRRLREIYRVLPPLQHTLSDVTGSMKGKPSNSRTSQLPRLWMNADGNGIDGRCQAPRFSTLSSPRLECLPQDDFLAFAKSVIGQPEGSHHCWLNRSDGGRDMFSDDGVYLVLMGVFLDDSVEFYDRMIMLENAKLLKQRYPKLHIFCFQSGNSVHSIGTQNQIMKTILEEYITFPVLCSDKNFSEMTDGVGYLAFKSFRSPLHHHKYNVELDTTAKVIQEFHVLQNGGAVTVQKSMKSGWYDLLQNWNLVKVQKSSRSAWCRTEDIKEPYVSSSFRNLLHFFPGFVSADEDDNLIFFSDTNHHRIIVTNGDGRILDCIGSSPGFEDGDFESAKLLRPTASFYDDAENCLYFVDSENHAIRRADMERRVLKTIYPTCSEKGGGIGYWILDKFGMERQIDLKPGESSANSLSFPWHLIKSESNDLLVINRRFDTLWILNVGSGEVKEVYKGFSSIMEMCGQIIMEKVAPVKAFPEELKQRLDHRYSVNGFPYAGLVSSIASLQNSVVFCDTAGPVVLKCHNESKEVSLLRLSNFEVLGFPYWCACPLEGTSVRGAMNGAWRTDLLQQFSVMPGRCDIRLNVHIPEGTELVEPLKEGCIWRQARGSAAVVSGLEDMGSSAEKVGVAQQWFDELDNLAFSKSSIENETKFQERNSQTDKTVHIDCAVNISPGTSEVVVSAVLYLKLAESESSIVNDEYSKTLERMLDLQKNKGIRNPEKEACLQIVAESFRDIGGLIFLKPLHLRIRLNVLDRPTTERSNEAISDQSSLEVNVSLD